MSHAGFLTKTDVLKSFWIRLMASAEPMWASQLWGRREDKMCASSLISSYPHTLSRSQRQSVAKLSPNLLSFPRQRLNLVPAPPHPPSHPAAAVDAAELFAVIPMDGKA